MMLPLQRMLPLPALYSSSTGKLMYMYNDHFVAVDSVVSFVVLCSTFYYKNRAELGPGRLPLPCTGGELPLTNYIPSILWVFFSVHITYTSRFLQQRQQCQPQPATAPQKNKQRTSSAWYLHTHSFHPPDQTCASRISLLRFESIRQAFTRGFFGPKAMNGQWHPQSKPTVALTKMR